MAEINTTTSTGLLAFCEFMSGLPDDTEEMSDDRWYTLLTLSQQKLFKLLATHCPPSQYGDPVKLTTSDGGYTYNFAAFPWGRVEVRESRNGRLLEPGADYEDWADIVIEGSKFRFTNNQHRTYNDGPYARYAVEPTSLNAITQPTIQPASARVLIGYDALATWAMRGGRRDPAPYLKIWTDTLWGDRSHNPGAVGLIDALKTRFQFQSGRTDTITVPWNKSSDLTNPLL